MYASSSPPCASDAPCFARASSPRSDLTSLRSSAMYALASTSVSNESDSFTLILPDTGGSVLASSSVSACNKPLCSARSSELSRLLRYSAFRNCRAKARAHSA